MRGQRWLFFAVVVMTLGFIGVVGCQRAKPGAPNGQKDVVATVGNEVITMQTVDERISRLPSHYQSMLKSRKKELVEDMVLEALLFNEAKARGLENDKEVKAMLEEARKKIIISKLIKDEVENRSMVSDKEAEDHYNAHKNEFITPERWKASHILVKTEGEAKAILDELAKGKQFEDLAKEKSQDTSAKRGGDVGFFTKGQMVPEFEEAAFKLEVGKVSPIVKSQFGFHVIKLTDKKPVQEQELKDVSGRIKNELLSKKKQEAFDKMVADLKTKTKVVINESLLEEKKEAPQEAQPELQEVPAATAQ